MTNPSEAAQLIMWVALGMIAVAALITGTAVYYFTGNGIAGLSALLLVAALGLAALRWL